MSDQLDKAIEVTQWMTNSKVGSFAETCQQRFAYSYIHELKRPPAAHLAFGSGWDVFITASEGFQAPYDDEPQKLNGYFAEQMRDGRKLPVSEAKDLFITAFRDEAEEVEQWDDTSQNELEKQGVSAVDSFIASEADFLHPVKLQESLQIGINDGDDQWALTGTIDCVVNDERLGDGSRILDIKTSKRRWSAGQAQQRLQGVQYSLLAQHTPGFENVDIDKFTYNILIKNKQPIFQTETAVINDAMRSSHLNLVSSVRSDILVAAEREYWRPNRGSWLCSKKLCGYWKQCEKAHGGRVKE